MRHETNEAAKQSVTDCNHLGNAAKMRDALNETQSVIAKCMEILNRIPSGVPLVAPCMNMIAVHSRGGRCRTRKEERNEHNRID